MRVVATILIACAVVAACGDNLQRSASKELTSFGLSKADNPGLARDVGGMISGTDITLVAPAGTDLTHLVARFETTGTKVTVGDAAQESGVTANDFTSPVTYTVIAANGTTQDYTVTASSGPSDGKQITDFRFTTATNPALALDLVATINGTTISVIAPFGTDVTALVATFTTTGTGVTVGGTAQHSGVTPNDFTLPVPYTVTAADGTTATYSATMTIAPNHAKAITAYAFEAAHNPGLTSDAGGTINGTLIAVTVPAGTDVTALVATFSTTGTAVAVGTTAQVSGTTPNNFTNPVRYTVTAADGTTVTYTVTVTVATSSAKDLTAYAFLSVDNAGLTADVTATINGTAIAATVPFGTDVTALVATFSTTGASVAVGATPQTSGTTPNDFTSPVVYTVSAADATTRSYTVTVTVASSPAKDVTAFELQATDNPALGSDVTATITGTAIAATVPFGTDVTALVATFSTTGASVAVGTTVQASGITPNDFTSPVIYTVTAADGTTKDYTVTITIAASPAKDLTAFAFLSTDNSGLPADVTATITGTAIAATVPSGTDVTALIATFSTTGATVAVGTTVQAGGITPNDFTSPVVYTVTAANGTTKAYTVTVTIASNTAKDITAFAFASVDNPQLPADVTATITGTAIAATVPFGTDVTALIATFMTNGASVAVGTTAQASGITPNDFTSPVIYTVSAGDGSTQDFTVTVTIAPSPDKDLTAFAFRAADNAGLASDVTGTITGTAIAASVPFGTDVTALVATFTTTGASVAVGTTPQISGTTANDFTGAVVYTVTAADTTTRNFTVTVTVERPPTVTDVAVISTSPDNGTTPYNTGATTVRITGTGFAFVTCPAGVALDDTDGVGAAVATAATSCTVDSATQITATFPPGIRTNGAIGWNVIVTNGAGSNTTSAVAFVPKAGLLISEVYQGTSGASDHEFLEVYNPTTTTIDTVALGLKLHIRNTTPTDTNKTLTLVNGSTGVIPSHGFLLFMGAASVTGEAWFDHADYSYASTSSGLVTNGGAYISLSATAQSKVIDKVGWGTQQSGGFEGTDATSPPGNNSIERLPAMGMGDATDTDDNAADFTAPSTTITPLGSVDPVQP